MVSIGADVETSFGALEVEDEEEEEEGEAGAATEGAPIGVAETGGAGGAASSSGEPECGLLCDSPDEGILFAVETSCCSWRLVDRGAGRPDASAAAPEVELLNEDVDGTLEPPPPPPEASSVPPAGKAPARSVKVPDRFRRLNFCCSCLESFLSSLAFLQEYASIRPFST